MSSRANNHRMETPVPVKNNAEKIVSSFYNTQGWQTEQNITEDARRWEDLRECASEYVSKCRLRVFDHIPAEGENILDMASGPIQYEEYLEYSKNFDKRYCIDLSSAALESAKEKIASHGVFLHGSFFDIPLQENLFDCSISLHTIYHIDKDKQEEAVRKLLKVTKPGKPVIIVYSNPDSLTRLPSRLVKRFKSYIKGDGAHTAEENKDIYFFAHPPGWWNIFSDVATIEIVPWRSFTANTQKLLFPNNKIGKKLFDILYRLEESHPRFFAKHLTYPMIILSKKKLTDAT